MAVSAENSGLLLPAAVAVPEPALAGSSPDRPAEVVVPVLFIAGIGRSGSTLLDRLLGSSPKFHSGGEIGGVWSQGLTDDRLCSCGVRFSCCPFWQEVGSGIFAMLQSSEIAEITRYLRHEFPVKRMWRLVSRTTREGLMDAAPPNFVDLTARLYQGIMKACNQPVIVDSSKLATYLVMLAHVPSLRVHVVHLVRDPRAVAHSWLRPRVADPDGRSSMPRFGVVKSAVLWLIMNAAVEWVAGRLNLPYVRIRYEDLVSEPTRIVSELRSWAQAQGLGPWVDESGSSRADYVDLDVIHSISGNPMRFQHGLISIAEDGAWRADSRSSRAVTSLITIPLRRRYGYR